MERMHRVHQVVHIAAVEKASSLAKSETPRASVNGPTGLISIWSLSLSWCLGFHTDTCLPSPGKRSFGAIHSRSEHLPLSAYTFWSFSHQFQAAFISKASDASSSDADLLFRKVFNLKGFNKKFQNLNLKWRIPFKEPNGLTSKFECDLS